jgi:hypothetical protein
MKYLKLFEAFNKQVVYYTQGGCGIFAVAFKELYGGKYLVVNNKDGQFIHIVVEYEGYWYDATGKTDQDKLTKIFKKEGVRLNGDDELDELNDAELRDVYGDVDPEDVKKAKDWIKSNITINA